MPFRDSTNVIGDRFRKVSCRTADAASRRGIGLRKNCLFFSGRSLSSGRLAVGSMRSCLLQAEAVAGVEHKTGAAGSVAFAPRVQWRCSRSSRQQGRATLGCVSLSFEQVSGWLAGCRHLRLGLHLERVEASEDILAHRLFEQTASIPLVGRAACAPVSPGVLCCSRPDAIVLKVPNY